MSDDITSFSALSDATERWILGSILLDNSFLSVCAELGLTYVFLLSELHKGILAAMVALDNAGEKIDSEGIVRMVKSAPPNSQIAGDVTIAYLDGLADAVPAYHEGQWRLFFEMAVKDHVKVAVAIHCYSGITGMAASPKIVIDGSVN